jgi:hypothetical protein
MLRDKPVLSWIALCAVITAIVGLVIAAGIWLGTGGRWMVQSDPLMGRAAPVGTLLWVLPEQNSSIQPGRLVEFHPPGAPERTLTRRVIARNSDGTLSTKADLAGTADSWTLSDNDVIGPVEARWWAVGWLVRAAPILLGGAIVIWLATRRWPSVRRRVPLRVLGAVLVLTVAVLVVRPLGKAHVLGYRPEASGTAVAVVDTGLLPLRVSASGAGHVVLKPGQATTLHSSERGQPPVRGVPEVPFWWYVVAALLVTVSMLWSTLRQALGTAPRRSR